MIKFAVQLLPNVKRGIENIEVYLMSNGLSYHTGDEIVIDAGYTKF